MYTEERGAGVCQVQLSERPEEPRVSVRQGRCWQMLTLTPTAGLLLGAGGPAAAILGQRRRRWDVVNVQLAAAAASPSTMAHVWKGRRAC